MDGLGLITLLQNVLPHAFSLGSAVTGALITALFLRRNTSTQEFEKIKAGHFKEAIDDLLDAGKMTYTEYYKANNFLEIADKADRYYSENRTKKSDESYDFDWFIRFYESAGNISNEQMQDLWARILAGEISRPGSYSIHLIEILKNMNSKDAELFEKISSKSLCYRNDRFILNDELYRSMNDIHYSDLMRIQELGLINATPFLLYKIRITKEGEVIFSNENFEVLVSTIDKPIDYLKFEQFPFTTVGKELSSILINNTLDMCLIAFEQAISKKKNFNIILNHKITI